MSKGALIVIEGSDGSGKGTQFKLLDEALQKAGKKVATFDFPQYDQPSSYFVQQYLNGNYGTADSLGAYGPSFFYALDRFEASFKMRQAMSEGKIILCNRFTGSSMAHQGQKISSKTKRKEYFKWLYDMEFNLLNIPKPDLNIVLLMPADIAQTLIDQKDKRSYTNKKRDMHEADLNHLKRAVATFEELCQMYPESFTPIYCTKNSSVRPINDIHQEILSLVTQFITTK